MSMDEGDQRRYAPIDIQRLRDENARLVEALEEAQKHVERLEITVTLLDEELGESTALLVMIRGWPNDGHSDMCSFLRAVGKRAVYPECDCGFEAREAARAALTPGEEEWAEYDTKRGLEGRY
ncbi:hypothetical protein LCGC14_2377340 [marine sediment metagenome]|uniref:Uncharacterized protein n=1 Tax=marine sediment metagenome TaxID=412755 RepID=A0A0F9CP99_9ZZZZ